RVVRGRYIDQRDADTPAPGGPAAFDVATGFGDLAARAGAPAVERFMRRYLEKIDGMALERVPAHRVERLLVGQSAPEGFWYPVGGMGVVLDAMAEAIR